VATAVFGQPTKPTGLYPPGPFGHPASENHLKSAVITGLLRALCCERRRSLAAMADTALTSDPVAPKPCRLTRAGRLVEGLSEDAPTIADSQHWPRLWHLGLVQRRMLRVSGDP